MGSCSKKPVRTDVRPDKSLHTEDHSALPKLDVPAASRKQEVFVASRKQEVSAALQSPGAKYAVEAGSEPEELIRHYENQADLMSRYQLPPEDKQAEGKKKKSMIVFAQRAPVAAADQEEGSFESSDSVAEGVVGTVH
jgi:hypothetical protein